MEHSNNKSKNTGFLTFIPNIIERVDYFVNYVSLISRIPTWEVARGISSIFKIPPKFKLKKTYFGYPVLERKERGLRRSVGKTFIILNWDKFRWAILENSSTNLQLLRAN